MSRRVASILILLNLVACDVGTRVTDRPTVQPIIAVTPAPTQNVGATASAYARRSIPTPTPANVYIVRPGDTLTKIADNFETTIDELMAANNLSDPDRIVVGQVLRLPNTGETSAETATAITATP